MLRRARLLLLAALILVTGFTVRTYLRQKKAYQRAAPAPAQPLPANVSAKANQWHWTKRSGSRIDVEVWADEFAQIKEPATFNLRGLTMHIYAADQKTYNKVTSASATFDSAAGTMYADGDVEIVKAVPVEGARKGRLVTIRSSGVTFDSKTMRVTTDRAASVVFDQGEGVATGASYDPNDGVLQLNTDVKLVWQSPGAKPRKMTVEAGAMVYQEHNDLILLFPWARLQRESLNVESGDANVFLKDGAVEHIEAKNAKGSNTAPQRRLEFGAAEMRLNYSPAGVIAKIEGEKDARLASETAGEHTTVTANRMDLFLDPDAEESTLQRALATGGARVESVPKPRPNRPQADTRVLTSEVVDLYMREQGREIERVEAPSPAVAEFLPNRPGQKRRKLTGDRLTVHYGKQNHADSVESINVTTRTESEPRRKGDPPVVGTTRSKGLVAHFDPKTGELARLEQWDGFQYEEGARRATAVHASLDQATEVITLDQQARVWDDTGSTTADKIVLEQKTGGMTATGNVASARLPDKKAAAGGMLEGDAPLQARAAAMTAADRNRKLRYQGGAVVWQGARRIAAERIDIDRGEGTLQAEGGVVSTFPDAAGTTAGQKTPAALSTIRAARLDYSDKAKTAHYRGTAVLERPGLEVRSRELRLFFREEPDGQSKETKLDRLLAEGKVDLRQRTAARTATGGAERMEYFLGDEHGELSGGTPFLNDSVRGITRGERITWYSRSDRMMVDNRGVGPAVSRLKKK